MQILMPVQYEASTTSHVRQAIRSTTSSNFKTTSNKLGRFGDGRFGSKLHFMTGGLVSFTWV